MKTKLLSALLLSFYFILCNATEVPNEIQNADLLFKFYAKKIIFKKEDIIESHKRCIDLRDSIIYKQKIELNAYKDTLSAFLFFNNEETTIFSDNRLEKNKMVAFLKGEYKEKYITIKKIRELDFTYSKITTSIHGYTVSKDENKWNNNELKSQIKLGIKRDLFDALDEIEVIENRNLTFLSKKQLKYYEDLKKSINEIYYKYF